MKKSIILNFNNLTDSPKGGNKKEEKKKEKKKERERASTLTLEMGTSRVTFMENIMIYEMYHSNNKSIP